MKPNKKLVAFDLETTGLGENDKIVQIGLIIIEPNGERTEKQRYINPQMPIPLEATAVHGITDEMVANEPTFAQLAKGLFSFFKDADILGHNSDNFDIPFLSKEFAKCGIEFPPADANLIDTLKFERLLNPNDLASLYLRRTGQTLEGAHDAMNDIRATVAIFEAQNTDGKTAEEIDLLCQGEKKRFDVAGKFYIDANGDVCWNFGQHFGKPISTDKSYLNWFLTKGNPPLQTKLKLEQHLNSK
jgi:DNA polymerase-3 subunit epsilon